MVTDELYGAAFSMAFHRLFKTRLSINFSVGDLYNYATKLNTWELVDDYSDTARTVPFTTHTSISKVVDTLETTVRRNMEFSPQEKLDLVSGVYDWPLIAKIDAAIMAELNIPLDVNNRLDRLPSHPRK